jgi:hypothetical protein
MRQADLALSVLVLCGSMSAGCTHTLGELAPQTQGAIPIVGEHLDSATKQSGYHAAAEAKPALVPKPLVIEQPKPPAAERATQAALGQPSFIEPAAASETTAQVLSDAVVTAKPAQEAPLVSALRLCLEKEPTKAVAELRSYDKTNQEVLLCLLPVAARLAEGNLQDASARDVDTMLDELNSGMVPLRARAPLTIEKMCFCRRIDAFGVYQALPEDYRFRPNEVAQIYVEVRNFATQRKTNATEAPTYVIQLTSSAEILDYAGNRVTAQPLVFQRKKPDESSTERHDYFESYRFCIPDLPPGAYRLSIQVEDHGTRPPRRAHQSLDFRVTNLCKDEG